MKLIPFLLFMFACSPMAMKTTEDIVSGELSVIEQAVQDMTGVQKPSVDLVTKKF
jgi:hypothetical protein